MNHPINTTMQTADTNENQASDLGKTEEQSAETFAPSVTFWDESQIRAVVRHAASNGRSPEEFFNRKWKEANLR